ncbi:MAG: hypothetical protein DME18_06695 [Verrucomicrobia bacterium]|nr:MAG: hypothetical protein DME19_19135 [Verrucomicrobiota bacterium]PYM14439.1 MAG: hypothetical protein DME18_06695 [Verrucomicrobiota bacterium]
MSYELEFIGPNDKPALLALSTPEWLDAAKNVLAEVGYKVHAASNHDDFSLRFGRIQYHVVLIEELFACNAPEENLTLQFIQQMSMPSRRHTIFILLGSSVSTLSAIQAFQHSVHAVVNREELGLLGPNILGPIVQRVVADNDLFFNVYRDTQLRIVQGKV